MSRRRLTQYESRGNDDNGTPILHETPSFCRLEIHRYQTPQTDEEVFLRYLLVTGDSRSPSWTKLLCDVKESNAGHATLADTRRVSAKDSFVRWGYGVQ